MSVDNEMSRKVKKFLKLKGIKETEHLFDNFETKDMPKK